MNNGTGRWQLGFTMSLTTAVLWGFLPIALKVALTGMDAYTITWWRFAVSMLGLGAFLAWRGQLPRLRGTARGTWMILGIALVTLLANYVFYLVSLDHTTPSIAQVVIQLAPLLLLLGGVFVFRERFAPRQWIGFVMLIVGLLLFFNRRLPELAHPGTGLGLGVALMVVASIAWAIYGLAQKHLLRVFTSRQVLWMLYVGATIALLPSAALTQVLNLDGLQLSMLAFCCANTLVAYGAFGEALHYWDVSRVSAVLTTAPLFTLASIWLIGALGWELLPPEGLNAWSVVGALAVVGGSMTCALAARTGNP
ncbi:MAG: DMT family transporter [Gammaproteobacteria bacterium]|nr:DMT family transporter [Gammaproteobacteria bacterium]